MRGNRYKDMHVIPGNVTLDDLDIIRPAYRSDQIPSPLCNAGSQDGLAVFRDPHNVILDVVYRVARLPVMLPIPQAYYSLRLKARVFLPFPEGDTK